MLTRASAPSSNPHPEKREGVRGVDRRFDDADLVRFGQLPDRSRGVRHC